MSNERERDGNARVVARAQHVLFAETPPGITIGAVSDSEPSSLALLAAGIAGVALRRARRAERIQLQHAPKTER